MIKNEPCQKCDWKQQLKFFIGGSQVYSLNFTTWTWDLTIRFLQSQSNPHYIFFPSVFAAKLQKWEVPKKIKLCKEAWTPDTGLVTDAFKLKRKPLQDYYDISIRRLYGKWTVQIDMEEGKTKKELDFLSLKFHCNWNISFTYGVSKLTKQFSI